jgi:hypothetical protein
VEGGLELPLLTLATAAAADGVTPARQRADVTGVAATLMLLSCVSRTRGRRELRGSLQLLHNCLQRHPPQHDCAMLAAAAVRLSPSRPFP